MLNNEIEGVGEITANAFITGYRLHNDKFLTVPVNVSYYESPKLKLQSNKFDGFAICMTGFRDDNLSRYIVANGGKVVSGVSSKTTHLLVKDKSTTSSKAQNAAKFGTIVMTPDEFLKL